MNTHKSHQYVKNRRGMDVDVEGRTVATAISDLEMRLGRRDAEHNAMDQYFEPFFDNTLHEIMLEVEGMRYAGKLRPFVEGEAIGGLPRVVKKRPMTTGQIKREHDRWMEYRQEAMLEARRQNNITMREILEA